MVSYRSLSKFIDILSLSLYLIQFIIDVIIYKSIRELYLQGNQLKDVPIALGYLTALEKLELQNNHLVSLRDEVIYHLFQHLSILSSPIISYSILYYT